MSFSTPSGLASSQLNAPSSINQPLNNDLPLHTLVHFFEQLCGRIALHVARHSSNQEQIAHVAARVARHVLQADHQTVMQFPVTTEPRKKPKAINLALAKCYDNAVDSGYSTDGSPPSSPVHAGKKRRRPARKLPMAPRIRVRRIPRHPVLEEAVHYLAFRQIKWRTSNLLHLENSHSVFSVLSWNLLSPKYCTMRKFPHMQQDYANWNHRRKFIMNEVLFYEPDIVCLQEVESDDYVEYFEPLFHAAGYAGLYDKKKHDYIMDGCATFYKTSRFERVAHESLHYNAVHFDDCEQTFYGSSRHVARACRFDVHVNLAQIITLRNKQTRAHVRIVNTQLVADPLFSDAKLLQAALLVDRLTQLDKNRTMKRRRMPNIICGDLNSVPTSAVVQYLVSGKIHKREFLESDFGRFTSKRHLLHNLSLSSTYDACDVAFTTRSNDFTDRVDYILYSARMIRCIGVLGDLETKGHMWMPNELCPSDHIPIYSVLQQMH
jgi:mRNA deadenylase 3'-5' endonuclease subunit Ccr4